VQFDSILESSNLLSNQEIESISHCLETNDCDLPFGFSKETSPRLGRLVASEKEYIGFVWEEDSAYASPEEISANQIRITINKDVWIFGIKLVPIRKNKRGDGDEYDQNLELILKRVNKTVKSTKYHEKVTRYQDIEVMFERPYLLRANVEYKLQLNFPQSDDFHLTWGRLKQTMKSPKSGIEMNLLDDIKAPWIHLILSVVPKC
jgi:hypothetical protein